MKPYSIEPRDQIFVKDYRFFPFTKNIAQKIGINFGGKYSQKLLDLATQLVTDIIRTALKGAIQKMVETTGGFIGNKIADVVAKFYNDNITSTVSQSNSETVSQRDGKSVEITKERSILRKKATNYLCLLRLI